MFKIKHVFVATALLVGGLVIPASAETQPSPNHLESLVKNYLAVQTALAGDSLASVTEWAESIKALTREIHLPEADQPLLSATALAATKLASAQSIEEARAAFGKLSEPVIQLREHLPGKKPNVAFCPMADKSWLQSGEKIANPYYGSQMLRCGTILKK